VFVPLGGTGLTVEVAGDIGVSVDRIIVPPAVVTRTTIIRTTTLTVAWIVVS